METADTETIMATPTDTEKLELRTDDGTRSYFLRWPTVADRTSFRHAVAQAGGRQHALLPRLAAMRRAVQRLMDDATATDLPPEAREAMKTVWTRKIDAVQDAAIALYNGVRLLKDDPDRAAQLGALNDTLNDASADLAEVESAVRGCDPYYATLLADNEVYGAIAGQQAASMFLKDWDGFGIALARERLRLSEECLSQIPESHFPAIAAKIEAMFGVPESKRKNSPLLSPSPSGSKSSLN